MKARITRRALPVVLTVSALGVAALGVAAPTASAASLTPASHDFGSRTVGTTSASQPFTLTAICTTEFLGLCIAPDSVVPAPVSTSGDFAQTNNCQPLLFSFVYLVPDSCTINVTFTPTTSGLRTGTLTAGGFIRSLSGTGVAVTQPTTPTTTPSPTFNLQAAIKKCKKKYPKGPKRKKCIKKAKARAG
jgi:hypothetical protein